MALQCPPVAHAGNWLARGCRCFSSLAPSHSSLSRGDCLVSPRCRGAKKCPWVSRSCEAESLCVRAHLPHPPTPATVAGQQGLEILVHLSTAVSVGFLASSHRRSGNVPVEWQAGLTFSYVTVTGEKGKKKKKMDCRKPFKSHTKMSHLGLMLPLKQEWYQRYMLEAYFTLKYHTPSVIFFWFLI